MRWDRLALGIGLSYALLAWSLGYGAVLPELRDELDMSASLAAIHGSLFGISLILLASFGSRLLRAFSNRTLLVSSVGAMTVGGLLFGLGPVAPMTLSGAAVAGAGGALLVIVVPAVVFAHQPKTATQAMSTLNAFPMVSATLLPAAVSIAVATEISWRVSYLAPMLILAVLIAVSCGRARVPHAPPTEPASLGEVFGVPRFFKRWFLLVCGVLVELGIGMWAATIMREQGGASRTVAALLTVGFFVGMAVGRIGLTHILGRFSQTQVLIISLVGSIVALGPFLLGPSLPARVLGLTAVGLFLSPVYPLSITRMFDLHTDTAALGRAAALASGFGVTFGPLLLGALSDVVGLGWATAILPVFLLVALAMVERTPALDRSTRPAETSCA